MPISNLTQNIKNHNGDTPVFDTIDPASQENGLLREVSRTQSISYQSPSPNDTFINSVRSRPSFGQYEYGTSPTLRRTTTSGAIPKQLQPFKEENIKVLLLENVNLTGREILQGQGYQVEALKSSLPEDELIEKIKYGYNFCMAQE